MNETVQNDEHGRPYTGQDVLHREKGVTALDVQRAADALLRRGQKPSIAAVREELGGGSPNTLGPLLEKYWKGLGTRLPLGPESLERVPESLARMTEALWLRSLDEARERTKVLLIGPSPVQREAAALQAKVTELTAALAESRARSSELEAQALANLRERLDLKEQVKQLTRLLGAEQAIRTHEREIAEGRRRDTRPNQDEILALARRSLATPSRKKAMPVARGIAAKKRATRSATHARRKKPRRARPVTPRRR